MWGFLSIMVILIAASMLDLGGAPLDKLRAVWRAVIESLRIQLLGPSSRSFRARHMGSLSPLAAVASLPRKLPPVSRPPFPAVCTLVGVRRDLPVTCSSIAECQSLSIIYEVPQCSRPVPFCSDLLSSWDSSGIRRNVVRSGSPTDLSRGSDWVLKESCGDGEDRSFGAIMPAWMSSGPCSF